MNERLKTHSKTQKKSADLVSNKLRIGVFQRYQMKCKSVSKKSPRYTYQEALSSNQAPALYAISLVVVFLALAALYESWSIPFSVMLVVPLGVVGALLATDLRGLSNDVYFQVGLLTTIGLSAKNAILIVEFAVEMMQKEGKTPIEAIIEAARMRLRPILMTSLAFILGVLPLVISHGAGSGAQNAVGTGVMGGMFAATVLAIYFVPVFFVVVEHLFARFKKA